MVCVCTFLRAGEELNSFLALPSPSFVSRVRHWNLCVHLFFFGPLSVTGVLGWSNFAFSDGEVIIEMIPLLLLGLKGKIGHRVVYRAFPFRCISSSASASASGCGSSSIIII